MGRLVSRSDGISKRSRDAPIARVASSNVVRQSLQRWLKQQLVWQV
jgi:hypothetical protein